VLVGLIPAAGHGTRLGLTDRSKELVEVGRRPVVDWLVERMRAAGPDEVRIVTRPDKRDVVEHAERIGARVVLGHPPDVPASLRLGLEGLEPDDLVMWGYPDSIWAPRDGYAQLVPLLGGDDAPDVAVGLFRAPEPERSDVVTLDDEGWVTGVHIKQPDPPGDLIWGIAVARVAALDGLREVAEPGLLVDRLSRERRVVARWMSDEWTDVGTPDALAAARERYG
jgi:NDP-sugar pyrophosphorylase family protein